MAGRRERERGARPRLYTIPQTAPFLESLARAILEGRLPDARPAPDPVALAHYTILLPTRRACRAMRDAFLRVSPAPATLLPRLRPIGDVDEDATLLAPWSASPGQGEEALTLPPAIGALERRLVLTELVLKWSDAMHQASLTDASRREEIFPAATPAQASALAAQLIQLMDLIDSEGADLAGVEDLVPDTFAEHWQLTLAFLKIVTEHWPAYLEGRGVMAPYARRNALMASETARLASTPPAHPIIAAGSTGSVPATAALLKVIASLPDGAVVLPGLDTGLDEDSWEGLSAHHPEHPQFGMKQLLDRIGARRDDVELLPGSAPDPAHAAQLALISEVMRPAATTERWRHFLATTDATETEAALRSASVLEAPTAQDEAEAVALILRQAAEQPGKTAALVTPDRTLARRVSVRLETWGLVVDDSAGWPLAKTPPGMFMDLLAEAVHQDLAPVALMALLKHPLARLGRSAGDMRRAARLLELTAFRQPVLATGLPAAKEAMRRTRRRVEDGALRHPVYRTLRAADWEAVETLLADLERALAPLAAAYRGAEPDTVQAFARAHIAAAEALATDETGSAAALWRGEAGEALTLLLAELLGEDVPGLRIAARDYAELYRGLVAGQAVRPVRQAHPRLFIWGPLEARLQQPDLVVLGGLNEGTWPRQEDTDPWLNRPMRTEIGLPQPERRTGLAAHDVAQLLGAREVVLTRAAKVDGVPTVPSRWLLRLQALASGLGLEEALAPRDPWLAWAQTRDRVAEHAPAKRPEPCPPADARPTQLSVTRIEHWIANPYAIFARDILSLQPLDALARQPDAALRGTLIHEALHRFTEEFADTLPADAAAALVGIAEDLMSELGGHASVAAFWRPQFERFAHWFAETEPARRAGVARLLSEVRGRLMLEGCDPPFTLTAYADRIDQHEDDALTLYDYKTGGVPSAKQVQSLLAPQLPLEAAIAAGGGFEGLDGAEVAGLRYVRVLGRGAAGEQREAASGDPAALGDAALGELRTLVAAFAKAGTPYTALRRPLFHDANAYRYDDYAHLARVAEWLTGDGAEAATP